MTFIDTHTHIDGEEFSADREAVIERAKAAGVCKMFVPAIDLKSLGSVNEVCSAHPHYAYPMIGLHPEEVRADWHAVLDEMHTMLSARHDYIAIGEIGLDYYWSRDFAEEQLAAFEEQVRWSVETRLPLMIHCRKAQNEMVAVLRRYADDLPGGVFHCFTGNRQEAAELLSFDRFVLGIGGVCTFKSSHLREDLPASVPLSRIVLETDSPYMAPVPLRGNRNESSYLTHVIATLATCYGVSEDEVARVTTDNALRVFPLADDAATR